MHDVVMQVFSSSFETVTIFLYALLGGFVPALFWLWFWMHEKNYHTEPRRVIARVFLLGMVAVFIAYMIQKSISVFITGQAVSMGVLDFASTAKHNQLLTLIFVIIEEMLKFGAAYVIAFKTKIFNEPIDAFIYLMTAAIGFSAMENTLYLIQPLMHGETLDMIVTSHMRFIGSSVLHVVSSGILAVCIGLSFYKSALKKEVYVWIGMILACAVHWAFNVFLVVNNGSSAFLVFSSVWIVAIVLILTLERVKLIKKR